MKAIDLTTLRDRAYKSACEHGFHDQELSNEHLLMLVITELSEAVEADRSNEWNRRAKVDWFKKRIESSLICKGLDPDIPKARGYEVAYNEAIKGSIDEELADAAIRILDICGLRGFNAYVVPMELFPDCHTLTEHLYRVCSVLADWKNRISNTDFGFQLSQAMSYLFAYCERYDIDLFWHIEQKMKYNELRPKMHGKAY